MPGTYDVAGITVETLTGDITKMQVDAIVVGKSASYLRGGRIFSAILSNSACSARFRRECEKPAAKCLTPTSAVLIDGCGLPAKHIVLVLCESSAEEVVQSLVAAIECAHSSGLESIALPLLGGYGTRGNDGVLQQICCAIVSCALRVQSESERSNLKRIALIVNADPLKTLATLEFDRIVADPNSVQTEAQESVLVTPENNGCPSHWSPMDLRKIFALVPLSDTDREFNDIASELMRVSIGGWHLHAVLRVQNPTLYKQYMSHKEMFERKYSSSAFSSAGVRPAIERSLFHGTRADTVELIAEKGFDRSHSGKNAAAFGFGAYFARDLSYSAQDQYSVPGPAISQVPSDTRFVQPRYRRRPIRTSYKYIFRARVLVGRVCLGSSDMRYLPTTPGNADAAPDCAVDDDRDPSIFVVFKDTQAYPEYLLVLRNH